MFSETGTSSAGGKAGLQSRFEAPGCQEPVQLSKVSHFSTVDADLRIQEADGARGFPDRRSKSLLGGEVAFELFEIYMVGTPAPEDRLRPEA